MEVVTYQCTESEAQLKDVWLDGVFPHFYQEPVFFWLRLCLVSKYWFNIVCRVKSIIVPTSRYPYPIEQCRTLTERFGATVEVIETHTEMIPFLEHFKSLRELRLTYLPSILLWEFRAINLTSLTLGKGVHILGLENLVNLEHLSMMYINNTNRDDLSSSDTLRSLKRLHLGRNYCLGVMSGLPDSGNATNVRLIDHVPKNANLIYLECDDCSVLKELNYTGRGRVYYGYCNIYYEGDWKEGKRHGEVGIKKDTNGHMVVGTWKDDIITEATITWKHYTYHGQVSQWYNSILSHGIGKREWMGSHGVKMVYDGEFYIGLLDGRGKLYKDGLLIREGRWSLEEEVD